MKVILVKSFAKLGQEGDLVTVKDGYANNYLIPAGFALRATETNFKLIEDLKREQAKAAEKAKQKFLKLKDEIEKVSLTIAVEAKENDELYGSVSQAQILKLLGSEGIELSKGKIIIDSPIEKLGVFNLKVELFAEITANLRIWVVRK